jgi:N-acetylmuramoyl-L-alanine amidase
MVLAGAAYGQVRSADVLYTFRESVPSPGFRVGDECFVAIETAELWGWKVKTDGTMADVDAEGHKLRVTLRFISGRTALPLRLTLKELGGESDWTSGTDTLNVFSTLTEVSTTGAQPARAGQEHEDTVSTQTPQNLVVAKAPLQFKPFPFYLNPGRTVIDLDGVRLGPNTKQNIGTGARMFQYRANVVRILVDTPYVPKLTGSLPETDDFEFPIQRDPDQPATDTPPPPVQPIAPPTKPAILPLAVSVDQDSESVTTLGFHLSSFQGSATISQPDPDTLLIRLPGTTAELPAGFKAETKAVESLTAIASSGSTLLTVKLARPMGSEITSGPTGVTLSLLKPNVGDGKLAGKLIVVDPGHGGHDKGAHEGDLNEKDLNLAIGKQLAKKLAEAGATVITTRQSDVFIPLLTRSEIANSNHADFFVSCHINSTGGSGDQSGTITFHHEGNKTGYLLAVCIQHEIAKVNGLPNLGVWSDGRIYSTGFSVLRHTKSPAAVLIEFGFINSAHDRARIVKEEFQDAVTTAVVKGLRVFLGESKSNG